MNKPRVWTLTPYGTTPGRVQAILWGLPEMRGVLQPGLGAHGEVSEHGPRPPEWMQALGQELTARGIRYTID